MLFKRIIEGKSVLKPDGIKRTVEKCSRSKSECGDSCGEHSTILEDTMKMALLGFVLWAGVIFGSHVAPYPLSLIVSREIMHPPPMYDYPFPSSEMLKRLPPVKTSHTNRSIEISKLAVSMLQRLEDNLHVSGVAVKQGSSAQGLLIQGYPSEDVMHYEKSSMIITKASQNLVATRCTRFGLGNDECASFISTLNLRESEYGGECATLERFTCGTQKTTSRYRTFDGSCNNPVRSSWGQALTGYKRLLHPRYADGIEEPRRAISNHPLPSPRLISTSLVTDVNVPDETRTLALAVWSQFVLHDLSHTPTRKMIHSDNSIRCCDNSGYNLAPRYRHPSCLPISIPVDDPYFSKKYVTCMEYTRSVTTYRGDCTFGASEQMNQATHFLDGSPIYGSNSRVAMALREKTGGLLKTTNLENGEFLPLVDDPLEKCLLSGDAKMCFKAGDVRANEQPWLGALAALAAREHNRVARALARLQPAWRADRLYHEARRVVVAQLQHITYKHWLPALTGKSFDELYDHYDTGYNSDVDPTVTNSFATAAFHFVNSLLHGEVRVVDAAGNVTMAVELSKLFYNPEILTKPNALEGILRGMVQLKAQAMDFHYADDLSVGWLGGLDAMAVELQRAREHGLPAYAHYRALCGLPEPSSFHHLADLIPQQLVDKLSEIYEHPHDIDLIVGAMAERPEPGSLLGPTFTCLIKEQMWRTRVGDRYFYTHAEEAGAFSKRQLQELRRASLARLLCDNSRLARTPRDAFSPPSAQNPIVSCDEIKKVNLEAWKDPSQEPDIIVRTHKNLNKWIKDAVVG